MCADGEDGRATGSRRQVHRVDPQRAPTRHRPNRRRDGRADHGPEPAPEADDGGDARGAWSDLGRMEAARVPASSGLSLPRLARQARGAPRAVERGDDEPARPPRGGRADQAPPRSERPPRGPGGADRGRPEGVQGIDHDSSFEGSADRLGAQPARAGAAERSPATSDDRLREPRGRTLMAAIEAHELKRTYRTSTWIFRRRMIEVEAVRGVSFEITEGELFGLLGPNGAGKTTTIKMLITLLIPTAGSARVLGFDVVKDAREVRKRIGYVFGGERGLYERLSGFDNLRYFAELYAVPPREQRPRIAELLELVGLAGREKERVEGYSRGMRQRLHVARGLLHDPPVLFLDEPTIGLDPIGARELRATIASLTQAGKTILLTTHYMFEADQLCNRIAVISKGEIVA